ncbi:glycosyltransferase family 2 protein [Butyricimonas virosa]|uniref:glycosyltransferase family 2 protein n=1 Tax=Butyricimonas virosa TaxID=544645 RepID=UPI002666F4DF|nr:glycosyltransferase [Butyricimonas virosa]
MDYSVLMSVYIKEQAIFLKEALESVFAQTLPPGEVVIVKDGPLTEELEQVLVSFQKQEQTLKVITLEQNMGLGKALQVGLEYCQFDLVARMDTDDICKPKRFEKQVHFMKMHPDISVVGTWIEEFSENKEKIESIRELPLENEQLLKFMKWRNPFNHMTVMFRKQAVISVGSYQPFYLLEDYYLWNRMANAGLKFANIGECLLWARGGYNMLQRRGGWRYVVSEYRLLHFMWKSKRINFIEFVFSLSVKSIVRMIGKRGRSLLYRMFLRK